MNDRKFLFAEQVMEKKLVNFNKEEFIFRKLFGEK